jgi:hypothetical protein
MNGVVAGMAWQMCSAVGASLQERERTESSHHSLPQTILGETIGASRFTPGFWGSKMDRLTVLQIRSRACFPRIMNAIGPQPPGQMEQANINGALIAGVGQR